MAEGTAALRAAAPHWSLAGDQQLLDILQNIHQRILSKCNETTARLDEMSRGLRDASVNLQNVNNKFLALSNTQFVESRVYDDDADVTAARVAHKEPPQLKDLSSDLSKLKESLQVLESYHEPLHILRDSDSDSDAGDDRLVLKPRDLYSDRPLPYIIGSQAWRSKWHAGLVVESSDSDSSVSRAEEAEQFSDSEGDGERREKGTEYQPDRKISAGSSLHSEVVSLSPERPSPSAVAAELARRLGGDAKVPETEPVYTEPDTVVRKLYKPQQPVATTIFPEEPPPLDETSSDEDIFAELHKTRPTARSDRVQSDLFDFTPKTNSLEEALFGRKVNTEANQTANYKTALFEDEEPVKNTQEIEKGREDNIKKPVGGISLFGTNQHAESIGAAILKRNRRKSSNSDESNTEEVKEVKDVKEVPEVKKERDIFDDLFAKSEKLNKKSAKTDVTPPKEVKKKDVFSDLFDDIDDIFSTDIVNVQIKETKKDEKALFTDDDDLFVEISNVKNTEKETAKVIEKSNVVASKVENVIKDTNQIQNKVVKDIRKESKGLFDSDSDDGLFTNATKDNAKEKDNKSLDPVEHKITNDDIFGESDEGDDLFAKNKYIIKKKEENKNLSKNPKPSKSVLFDSDDELFTKNDKGNTIQEEKSKKNILSKLADVSRNALFDSDDELFTNIRKDNETHEKEDKRHVSEAEAPSKNDIIDSDEELFTNNRQNTKTQGKEDENHVSKAEAPTKNALLESHDELFTKNVKKPRTNELEVEKNDTSNKNNDVTIVNKSKKPENELFDENDNDPVEDLFQSNQKSKALKVIESINNDIFNDGDELFKKSETLNKADITDSHDSFNDKSILNNKSFESENKSSTKSTLGDTQSDVDSGNQFESEQPQTGIFNRPDLQTANILRTTRIASEKENMQTDKVDLIDDSDDELFKKSPDSKLKEAEVTKNDLSRNILEPVSQDLSKPEKNDIFTDIFDDAPPLFEKPKEPKKSRNVNALFDDDSDDEALFFKKNDVITDDKPDFSPSEEKFDIFFDEPPAIDIDFTQKSNESSQKPKIKDSGHKVEEVDGFSMKPNLIKDVKVGPDKPETITVKDTQDITDNFTKEPKKVGKLKPMNFNINVNTLLPGASPKKKQNESKDEHTASNEDLHITDKVEPKLVKSISFDDPEILDNKISKERAKIQVKRRPSTRRARKEAVRKSAIDLTDSSFDSSNDSSVKDNVKHTVVKTVYILNDDDIFGKNNVSGTESTKKQLNIVDSDEELFKTPEQKDETDSKLTIDSKSKNDALKASVESKSFLDSDDDDLFKNKINKSMENRNENLVKNEKNSFLDDDDDDDLFKQTTVKTRSTTVDNNLSQSSSITDDISFSNTETKSNEIKKVIKNTSFLDSDDNDDLFTNKNTQETTKTMKSNISPDEELFTNSKGIETLGKVYETKDVPAKVENRMHSIFDDFPPKQPENAGNINTKPEEVKATTKVEKPAFKSILDDSSDEDDLFKTKTKLATKKDAKSLFGDDLGDIGEDLFGAKTVKEQKQDVLIPQTSKANKSTEPVFADPLSLFENDD